MSIEATLSPTFFHSSEKKKRVTMAVFAECPFLNTHKEILDVVSLAGVPPVDFSSKWTDLIVQVSQPVPGKMADSFYMLDPAELKTLSPLLFIRVFEYQPNGNFSLTNHLRRRSFIVNRAAPHAVAKCVVQFRPFALVAGGDCLL